jgi:hypothetical protein
MSYGECPTLGYAQIGLADSLQVGLPSSLRYVENSNSPEIADGT